MSAFVDCASRRCGTQRGPQMSCADAAMLLSCTDLREFAIVTDSSCWPLCDGCCRDDAPPFVPPPSFPHPLLPPSVPPPRDPPPPPLLPPSAPPALPNSVLVDVLPRSADLAGGESVNLCVANAFDTLELTCKWDTLEGVKLADALKLPGAAPGVLDERCGEETTYMCSTPSVAETMSTLLRVESAHLGVIGLVDFTFFERAFPPVISAVLPPAMDIDTAQRRWGSTAPLLITVQGYNFRPGKQQTCLLGSIAASAEFVRSDLYRCTVPQLNLSSSEQVHGVSLPVRISVDGAA
uniref:IPT/TIG domain-containing protein n=1 Tax=Chrysotila carterae TaxID=13221 RepID=A0A7S4BEY4_CHRCT